MDIAHKYQLLFLQLRLLKARVTASEFERASPDGMISKINVIPVGEGLVSSRNIKIKFYKREGNILLRNYGPLPYRVECKWVI